MAYVPFNQALFVGPFVIKEGDTENKITVRLMDEEGNPEDLSGATVTWSLSKFDNGLVIADRGLEKLSDGKVRFGFTSEDATGHGAMLLQFKVDRAGVVELFPAASNLILYITPDANNLAHTPVSYASLATVERRMQDQFDAFAGEVQEGAPGVGLTYTWDGTRLGVKRTDEPEFEYMDLLGPRGLPGIQGEPGEPGPPGTGLEIQGTLNSTGDLPATGSVGDAYLINQHLWIWGGSSWEDAGSVQGPPGEQGIQGEQGPPGEQGIPGQSLEFHWDGTRLGIRLQGETVYNYTDLRGPQGLRGLQGLPGNDGIDGVDGSPGKSLEFTWSGTSLGVRQEGGTYQYTNLIGPKGDPGSDGSDGTNGSDGAPGKNLEFSWNGTQLGVRQEGETTYNYVDLIGPRGLQGEQGEQGVQGIPGVDGSDGSDGKNLEFSWNGTQLGVRQQGQTTYSYTDLRGPKGDPGSDGSDGSAGADGKSLEFTWNGTQLGVRQQGGTYQYTDLRGPQGLPGNDGADGSNGVDGLDLQFTWSGTSLGVRQEGGTYQYTNLKGDKGDKGDPGTPGSDGADATLFIEPRTSDPANPQIGQVWLRTDL